MQINMVSSINFTSGYDIHVHSGHWWMNSLSKNDGAIQTSAGNYAVLRKISTDTFETANKLLTNPDEKIEKMFVSNLDCMVRNHPDMPKSSLTPNGTPFLSDEIKGNMDLLQEYKDKPNYVLYATCQPGFGQPENIEKVITEAPDKFKGLKFHPKQFDLRADASNYDEYLKLAEKYKLPCLFHSQVNIDYSNGCAKVVEDVAKWDKSDPEFIYNLAKRHPKVPIIMAHMGAGGELAHQKAIDVLLKSIDNNNSRLYCDISWVDFENGLPSKSSNTIINLIDELKKRNALERVMFGTDAPLGCYGENLQNIKPEEAYKMTVDNLKNSIRENFGNESETIINKIFYENAQTLFFANENRQVKTAKNFKVPILIFAGLIFTGGIVLANKFKSKQNLDSKNSVL